MIVRVWHGWTAPEDAQQYERLLTEQVLPEAASIDGYDGADVLRRPDDDAVEFVTLLRFESYDAVEQFAGAEYEEAHVPPAARELLVEFDEQVRHYERRPPTER